MPVLENSATALIRVRGLGIACFNKTNQRNETSLIRDGRHQLTVKISKPVFIEEADAVSYNDIVTYESIDPMDSEIEISASGNSTISGYEIFTGETFDRLNPENTDENDFRWIVKLESDELHGGRLVKNDDLTAQNQFGITKLYISDALFYTNEVNEKFFFEKVKKDAEGNEIERSDFGCIAETMGAKIEAESVVFKLKIGSEEHTHVFPRVIGSPVKIEISNVDPDPTGVVSDMPDYYRFVRDESGIAFDLSRVTDDDGGTVSGDSTAGVAFCHIISSDECSV